MTQDSFIDIKPLIKIDDEENDDLRQALSSFVINLPLSGMAHGELTASNWIQSGEAAESGFGFQGLGFGKKIELLMGENQDIPIFSGDITAVEERYGNSAPQIILLLQDKMHILARQRESRVFEDQSIDDIVNTIAGEVGLNPDVNVSSAVSTYYQMNESNLAFLSRLLHAHGCALRIDNGSLRAKPEEPDSAPLELSARDSAKKVRLIADLNHQPLKVTVKGFNISTNEDLLEEVDALENPGEGTTAKNLADELSWPGDNIVPQPVPRDQDEAGKYARAHFDRNARRFISGDISCVGEPELKSGREICLTGVSSRMEGNYQIVHCAHCFDASNGYETQLKVNRAVGQA